MPFVKSAPGRHKANALSFSSQLASCRHHSRNAIYYLHNNDWAIDVSASLTKVTRICCPWFSSDFGDNLAGDA